MATCSVGKIVSLYGTAALSVVIIPLIIWMLYRHISNQKKTPESKYIYVLGLLFYIVTSICLILFVIANVMMCISSSSWIVHWSFMLFYALHWNTVMILLFCRIYSVFKETSYQFSKCQVYTFYVLYGSFIVSIFVIVIGLFGITFLMYLGFVIIYLLMVIIPIYIFSVFIAKLCAIYRKTKDVNDDGRYISMITKNVILAFFCNLSSVCSLIILTIVLASSKSDTSDAIYILILFLDISSNCLCIVLSYKQNYKYYSFMCGCLDNCFKSNFGGKSIVSQTQQELSSYANNEINDEPKIINQIDSNQIHQTAELI
eukprot:64110_1